MTDQSLSRKMTTEEQIAQWSEEQPLIAVYYKGQMFYSKLMTREEGWEYPLKEDIANTFKIYKAALENG